MRSRAGLWVARPAFRRIDAQRMRIVTSGAVIESWRMLETALILLPIVFVSAQSFGTKQSGAGRVVVDVDEAKIAANGVHVHAVRRCVHLDGGGDAPDDIPYS